jgi:hypothetical protein
MQQRGSSSPHSKCQAGRAGARLAISLHSFARFQSAFTALANPLPPAIRYGIDALLILVPLVVMTYFLFDPAAFNAFTAWLARVL